MVSQFVQVLWLSPKFMVVRLGCGGKSWPEATGSLRSISKFRLESVMKNSFVRPWSGSNTLLLCCLLVAASLTICSRAGAQAQPDGSPVAQTQTVSETEQLQRNAQENAKIVAPNGTPPPVGKRHEPKALQNAVQPKQPDTSSSPNNSSPNSPKQTALTGESVAKPETIKQDRSHSPQSEESGAAVNASDASIWEPTGITVSRLFLASDAAGGEGQKVPMSVPVFYESRLLGLDKDKQRAIARLLEKLTSYRTRLAAIRKEGADLLAEWNQIISSSTPQDLLLSDSPTLVEKGSNDATAHGANIPGFEPGKGVSIQVKSTGQKR
jgi:hypothetical protein